jgi:hypothetical protein
MNEIYNITLSTPLGLKKGSLRFLNDNGNLSGSLVFMGNENPFTNGTSDGNNFEFAGVFSLGSKRFKYSVKGSTDGDTLKAIASTKFGNMQIKGISA